MKLKPQLQHLPIEQLQRGKFQPRKHFDKESLDELAVSIQSSGVIQPIVVRPIAEHQYEIVAGERRWRAALQAGFDTVPCLINQYTDEQTAAVTAIENVNRVDLNPIEEAQAYQRLVEDFHYLHDEISAVVGKSRSKISNVLRLLTLNIKVQTMIIEGLLSESHAKVLLSSPPFKQVELAELCVQKGWSVRKLEDMIKQYSKPHTAIQATDDIHIAAVENLASEQLGSPVKLEHDEKQRSGWLKIKYYNPEILAGILERLGIETL
jgi:ParB family transcriptional regulator, chromosome partitioning protein